MSTIRQIIIPFFLLLTFNLSAQGLKIKSYKNEDKIHVNVTGKETRFKTIKVETIVHAPIKSVVEFVTKVPNYNEWMFKCKDSKILEKTAENDYVYYVEIDMPYPATDRDVVIHSNYNWTDEKSFHLISTAKNDHLAHNKNFVRVTDLDTEWKIVELASNKTSVIHLNRIDPAGNLPLWMINLAVKTGPLKTVEKLKRILDTQFQIKSR